MAKKRFPLDKAYQLLEPGPVIMVTTVDKKGNPNIMTMSWHTMIDFMPPILGIVMSDQNYSFELLKKTKECVINIPTVALVKQAVGVGNCTGATVDKFKKFALTPVPAKHVQPPLIAECYAHLECRVIDMKMAKKYNLFILEGLAAWVTPSKKRQRAIHHCGNGVFVADGKRIAVPSGKK